MVCYEHALFLVLFSCIVLFVSGHQYFYEPLCGKGHHHVITYGMDNLPPLTTMSSKEVVRQVDASFQAWNNAARSALRFVKAKRNENAHILISFKNGKHRCVRFPCMATEAFPASNYVLAHSFNPRGGSEIHMNSGIMWLKECGDLQQVAAKNVNSYAVMTEILTHEIGHAIGIKHLLGEETIMHSGYMACSGHAPHIGSLDHHVIKMITKYCSDHKHEHKSAWHNQ